MLIVEPRGGVGNRMRVLDSGRSLANQMGCSLAVIWRVDDDLGASFADLFEPLDGIAGWHEFDYRTETGRTARERFVGAIGADISFDPRQVEALLHQRFVFDFPGLWDNRVVHIETWSRFYANDKPFADFRLKPQLAEQVAAIVANFDDTIGVHVRRTDAGPAIEHSPTESFIARMREAFGSGDARNAFLATDDPREQQTLVAAFPGRIISRPHRSLERSKPEAIEGAIVDLYCLAHTKRLLGSFASSFSQTAAAVGGIPMEEIYRPQPISALERDPTTVLTFGIPLKTVNDPVEHRFRSRMLSATLASIYAQTDGAFHIILAGSRHHDIDIPVDDRLEFLLVPSEPTRTLADAFADSGRKSDRIAARHAERGGGCLMFVDMDDFVSNRLVAFVRENPHSNGYLIERGYTLNARSNLFVESQGFNKMCGSSAILKLTPGDIVGRESRYSRLRSEGHYMVAENAIAEGRPLMSLPFGGAIWIFNHGANLTRLMDAGRSGGADSRREFVDYIDRTGLPAARLASEFSVPDRYPLLDDFLAEAGRQPPPTLSVVIVTYRRAAGLRRLLAALVPQVTANREIVVVNDGSHDDAYEAVRVEFDAVIKYRALPANVGVAKARNASAELARGDYLVFTDDDCEPPPWWLDWLEAQLQWSPDLDVVAGPTRPMKPARRRFFSDVQAGHNFLPTASRSASGILFATANVAVRRNLFWKLGGFGFPGTFHGASEDTDLAARLARAGASGCIDESWYVAHEVSSGFAAARRRYWRYGYANAALMRLTTAPQALDGLAGHRRRLGLRDWLVEYRRQRPLAQRVSRHRIVQVLSTLLAMLVSMAYFDGAAAALRDRDRRRVTFSA